MKKTLSLLLAALMLLGSLAACAGDDEPAPVGTTAAPSVADTTAAPTETTDPTRDANGFLLDDLPADLKFDGETVGLLIWEDVEMPEFDIEDMNGDIVNDAIFSRNQTVENRLGVKLEWHGTKGNNGNSENFLKVAQNSFNAGDGAYDIYAAYSRTSGLVALNGLCYNLNNVSHLNFEKPWWPQSMLDACTIGDKLFFISGDISTNVLHMMYGVYYNKDMVTNYQMTDPAELVLNGTWTIDKMIEMTQGLYADLNGNNAVDFDDRFGMATLSFHLDAFYAGSGMRTIERDAEKILVLSPDYSSEKAINLVDKLAPWINGPDILKGKDDGTYENSFVNSEALFCLNRMYLADRKLREVNFTYGVVPVPKYDESQENYVTCMANPFTLYSITRDCKKPDCAAAVLEAMASAAYRNTTPAIFETNMKVKYSADSTNAQMFDLIREGVYFELGRIYAKNISNTNYTSSAIWNNTPYASSIKGNTKLIEKSLERLLNKLNEAE